MRPGARKSRADRHEPVQKLTESGRIGTKKAPDPVLKTEPGA